MTYVAAHFIDAHDDGGVDVVAARAKDQHAAGTLVEQGLARPLVVQAPVHSSSTVHAVRCPLFNALRGPLVEKAISAAAQRPWCSPSHLSRSHRAAG